jgi:hypothetical protein
MTLNSRIAAVVEMIWDSETSTEMFVLLTSELGGRRYWKGRMMFSKQARRGPVTRAASSPRARVFVYRSDSAGEPLFLIRTGPVLKSVLPPGPWISVGAGMPMRRGKVRLSLQIYRHRLRLSFEAGPVFGYLRTRLA